MYFKTTTILLVFFLFSCNKNEVYQNIEVISHAGAGLTISAAPFHDNSLEAIEFALSLEGCDGVEVDVQMSSDGIIYLYHDEDLSTQTNATGCINSMSSIELDKVHYSTIKKEKLIRLDEVPSVWLHGKKLVLDIRHVNFCTGIFVNANAIISSLVATTIMSDSSIDIRCTIGNSDFILPFSNAGFKVVYSVYSFQEFESNNLNYPQIYGYLYKNEDITENEVRAIKALNKKVYLFEMRSPKGIKKALKKQPDGVITDDIRATIVQTK